MVRLILTMALVCLVAGIASAELIKGSSNGAIDGREGGESWADAVVINPNLPYSDTGATCDNQWNVDFSCGYTYGISPDVFYSFTACMDGSIDVSLCGSGYDTELAIFDAGQIELACNDDFCGLQSEIAFPVTGGEFYYIVVSGYYGGCGDYILNINGPTCPTPTQESNWSQVKSNYR
jgi:hypothetical protein